MGEAGRCPGPERMQRKPKSHSSAPYINQFSFQEELRHGRTMVAADDDLMKEDETTETVDDRTSIEEMGQDGMTDVDGLGT